MAGNISDRWFTGKGASRIQTSRHGSSGRWLVTFYVGGVRKKKSFENKDAAQMWLHETQVELKQGTFIDARAAKNLTVSILGKTWLESKMNLAPNTVAKYRSTFDAQISQQWGSRTVDSIKTSEISVWSATFRARGLSSSSAHEALWMLRSILDVAVKDGLMSKNPTLGVSSGRVTFKTKGFLDHSQLEKLALECKGSETMVRVLGATGIRFGELVSLKVENFIPLARRLQISGSTSEVNGKLISGPTKTNQDRRVPLSKELVLELSKMVADRGAGPRDWLFPAPKGGQMRLNVWRKRVFKPALERLGATFPAITPHSLRHSAASLSISAGADLKSIQRMLGHADSRMTLNTYGHLYEDNLDAVADAVEAAKKIALSKQTAIILNF